MPKIGEVYKCELCGNIVVLLHEGAGTLVCCGQNMKHEAENTVDASKEKHVPVIEIEGKVVKVKVGSVAHPMEEKHYIEWVEAMDEEHVIYLKMLNPEEEAELTFSTEKNIIGARAYCNLHGLWRS
ncbi:MAG: desulfoferrodoxin [Cyanobacteriota bacterium]